MNDTSERRDARQLRINRMVDGFYAILRKEVDESTLDEAFDAALEVLRHMLATANRDSRLAERAIRTILGEWKPTGPGN
jgi:hypothetical protein